MEIRVKRGLKADLPILAVGEFGLCTDTTPTELYIGTSSGNFLIGALNVAWNDVTGKPTTFPPDAHDHDTLYYTESEMDTKLGTKSDTNHAHTGTYEPVISPKNSAFNVSFGTTAGTACQGDDARLSDARTPIAHVHDDRYFTESETTSAISTAINNLINGSPGALDTLNELATAMGNDPNFATTITNTLAGKVDKVTGKQLSTEDFTTTLLTKLNNITGTNTGDETATTIKTKLGITTISGSNTGDQVIPTSLPASDVYAWAKATVKPTYTASEVGLGSVNNTADTDKPVSTAQQAALNLKANLISPAFTGTPTAPTPATADSSTQVATTAFVKAQNYVTAANSGVALSVILNINRKARMGGI